MATNTNTSATSAQNQDNRTTEYSDSQFKFDALKPDIAKAKRFLEVLGFNPNSKLPIRTFAGKPQKQFPNTKPHNLSKLPPKQPADRGVYIAINGEHGAHKKEDITQARAIFCEHDDLSIKEQLYLWQQKGLPEPTIQVKTRNSVHTYWVFTEPISAEIWEKLQLGLITVMQSDPTIKDISRVMRVPGYYHIYYGLEPEICEIISDSGKYYSYDELRSIIPEVEPEKKTSQKPSKEPQKQTKNHHDGFSTDSFLEAVCSKLDVEDIFSWEGHNFQYDASADKYRGYCPWHDSKSGTAFYIDNVSGIYKWRCPSCEIGGTPVEYIHLLNGYSGSPKGDDYKAIVEWLADQSGVEKPQLNKQKEVGTSNKKSKEAPKIPIKDAVDQAKKIITSNLKTIDENIELEQLRLKTGMSDYSWQQNYIKPLRKELQEQRLRLEINCYLKESDIIKRKQLKQHICSTYQIGKDDFNDIIRDFEHKQTSPEEQVFSFDDFWNDESEDLNWVIPGFLPLGETIILASLAKVGKSQLSTDVAYAVLSGGSVIGEQVQDQGGVLMVTTDESPNSTKRRLGARGFNLLPQEQRKNLRVMTHLNINDLSLLEQELDNQRPKLVVIDCLTSITKSLGISENDSEFARHIYLLKELISRYNSSCILIHHENKDKEAKGINKLAGNTRISASVWGIWQLQGEPKEEGGLINLSLTAREAESVQISLERNPKDLWVSEGIFSFQGEVGDDLNEKRTQGQKVIDLLKRYSPRGLEFKEIDDHLNIGRGLYTILDRLVDRKQITKRPSATNPTCKVYAISNGGDSEKNSPTPPSSTVSSTDVESKAETTTNKEIDPIQQSFNTHSTGDQQQSTVTTNGGTVEPTVESVLNRQNSYVTSNSEINSTVNDSQPRGGGSVTFSDDAIAQAKKSSDSHGVQIRKLIIHPSVHRFTIDGIAQALEIDLDYTKRCIEAMDDLIINDDGTYTIDF